MVPYEWHLKLYGKFDGRGESATELLSVGEPARLSKFPKMVKVSLKDMISKTNADAECLMCVTERLACSRVKVPVTSNDEIKSIALPHFLVYSHTAHCLVIKSVHSFINLVRVVREACN